MNPFENERKLSLVEWGEKIDFMDLPNGHKKLICPLCIFTLESVGFEKYLEMEIHIEREHPGNILDLYDILHPDKEKQKTLKEFGGN